MEPTLTDRNVGALDVPAPLPHHLSPAPKSRNLTRHDSESSVGSSSATPAVPRSSSFTGSKRFLTGKGLTARESLGLIDEPERNGAFADNAHFSYHAARNIIMDVLSRSPKEAPPPPQSSTAPVFVAKRPPTPPPMPDFTTPSKAPTQKRVRIDPKPPIELPAAAPMDTPPCTMSTPEHAFSANDEEKKRTPLRTLSPLRNRLSLSPPPGTSVPSANVCDPKVPRQSLFGLFSARITRREQVSTIATHVNLSQRQDKQNTAPLNIADLAAAAKVEYPTMRTDENNKPLRDAADSSSDDSARPTAPDRAQRMVVVQQMHPETNQRQQLPLTREKKVIVDVTKDNESMETTESEKYGDCESPAMEPRRRVEIFRRFRFVQEGRHRPEQLSDFVQTGLRDKPVDKPPTVAPTAALAPNIRVGPVDPISHHEDTLSFTSAHEDGERSSDEKAPFAMRDVRKGPRLQRRAFRPLEPERRMLEEEKGQLPHVESITTSSSSHSKETSDSPPVESQTRNAICDTSVPFSQAEMPHLRLGKGNVTANAFLDGPSPGKMGRVAQIRRDSHAAFLNVNREAKLEEIKYGGHREERETAPLGPAPVDDDPKEEGEIKKTMSGLQRRLKEAGAGFVSKAKKIPRGTSFSKLRSNSLKDLRSSTSGKQSEAEGETDNDAAQRSAKGVERSISLPRDSMRELPKLPHASNADATKTVHSDEKPVEKKVEEYASPEIPEFVTIKRIIRRVRRDGTEELVTKKVRVRPERVLPNGDVVIKRTMKRNKDEGAGTETLTVLQVIPRRKNLKKTGRHGEQEAVTKAKNDIASLPDLNVRREDKETEGLGSGTTQNFYDEGPMKAGERSGSLGKRRSSSRSKTDVVDEAGRWRRARSFGRVRADTEAKHNGEQRGGVIEGVKGLLPRSKSGSRVVDRETGGLGEEGEGKTWLKKKSLPRVMSFHGRSNRRKESGASSKSDGIWRRFRRAAA